MNNFDGMLNSEGEPFLIGPNGPFVAPSAENMPMKEASGTFFKFKSIPKESLEDQEYEFQTLMDKEAPTPLSQTPPLPKPLIFSHQKPKPVPSLVQTTSFVSAEPATTPHVVSAMKKSAPLFQSLLQEPLEKPAQAPSLVIAHSSSVVVTTHSPISVENNSETKILEKIVTRAHERLEKNVEHSPTKKLIGSDKKEPQESALDTIVPPILPLPLPFVSQDVLPPTSTTKQPSPSSRGPFFETTALVENSLSKREKKSFDAGFFSLPTNTPSPASPTLQVTAPTGSFSANLSQPVKELIASMIGHLHTVRIDKQAFTEFTIQHPPLFHNAHVRIIASDSAPSEVNISFSNLRPEAQALLANPENQHALKHALSQQQVTVHIITASVLAPEPLRQTDTNVAFDYKPQRGDDQSFSQQNQQQGQRRQRQRFFFEE